MNRVCIAKMDNPWTINEQSRQIICKAEYPWELYTGRVNEGGCFIEQGGKMYLAFRPTTAIQSPTAWDCSNFSATIKGRPEQPRFVEKSLTAPCSKPGRTSSARDTTPFSRSPDGSELWIAFHGRTDPIEITWERPLCFMKAQLNPDGSFVMDTTPEPSRTYIKRAVGKAF